MFTQLTSLSRQLKTKRIQNKNRSKREEIVNKIIFQQDFPDTEFIGNAGQTDWAARNHAIRRKSFPTLRHSFKGMRMIRTAILAAPLLTIFIATEVFANSRGITGYSREDNTCNNCHQGAFFNSSVIIEGQDVVAPGSLNDFVIRMTHDGNQGGFNMSSTDGTFTAGPGSSRQGRELTHNSPQNVTAGVNSWTFQWQAPEEAGNERLFLCANAVNGNSANSGDETNTACTIFRITVGSLNESPQANNDAATVNEDESVTIMVLDNDSDSDGSLDTSSVTIVSGVSSGSTSINAGGFVVYTPASNFNGSDTFSYTVADNEGAVSAQATVSINVISVNDVPVASDDSASTSEETPITIDVLANDSDVEDALSGDNIAIVSAPDNGSVEVVGNNISYQPAANFSGADSFTYRITDSDGGSSDPATVAITVVAVNDVPVAADDSAITDEDNAVTIDVLTNDSDVDGSLDTGSIAIVESPTNGTAMVASGAIVYSPNANFNGIDSFSYQVNDNEGAISNTAKVSVTINAVNDAPVAVDDVRGTNIDTPVEIAVLENDTDDGSLEPTSIVIVMSAANGSASAASNGVVTYTPATGFTGQDSFTYTAMDTEGLRSNEATVSVSVRLNEAPVANADLAEVDEDQSVLTSVLSNDSDDIEIDASSVQIVQAPSNGVATVSGAGDISYQPNSNFFGDDTLTYQVSDFENGTSDSALVSIVVRSVNDAPEFSSAPIDTVVQGRNYQYDITVADVDSDDLSVSLLQAPDWLTLDNVSAGNFTLTGVPPVSAMGSNPVVLQVSDGQATADQAFSILVTERTDADLMISIATMSPAGIVGQSLGYQFVISNNGPADASNVTMSASWQAVQGDFVVPEQCDVSVQTITCNIDLVTPESPVTLEIGFVATEYGDVLTTASVAFEQENNNSNNQGQIARSISESLIQLVEIEDSSGLAVVAAADINGDDFTDMVSVRGDSTDLIVSLNNGLGQFLPTQVIPLTGTVSLMKFAQLDDDTQQELLLVQNSTDLVFMDIDDAGLFTESARLTFTNISDVAVSDLNNDGRRDIVVAQSGVTSLVLKNQEQLTFAEEPLGIADSQAVAAVDVNGDTYPDLVFANGHDANHLYLNLYTMGVDDIADTNSQVWFDTGIPLLAENSVDVEVIDIDGDMQYEVVFANASVLGNSLYQAVAGELQLLATLGIAATREILIADLNTDGLSDLMFVQGSGTLQQWINNGNGSVELASEALFVSEGSGFEVADFNADGVPDIAVSASREAVIFNDINSGFAVANVDLAVTATLSAEVLSPGDNWNYSVTVSNNSESFNALNPAITLTIPVFMGVDSQQNACALTDGLWQCAIETLQAGESTSITLTGTVMQDASGELMISAQISNQVSDPDTSNNAQQTAILINAAPVANNDSVVVEHNSTAVISVLSNDSDDNGLDPTSVTIVSGPSNGSASVSANGDISYSPATDFAGSDSLTYQVLDNNGVISNVATVSITVNEKPDDGGAIHYALTLCLLMLVVLRRMAGGLTSVWGRRVRVFNE